MRYLAEKTAKIKREKEHKKELKKAVDRVIKVINIELKNLYPYELNSENIVCQAKAFVKEITKRS